MTTQLAGRRPFAAALLAAAITSTVTGCSHSPAARHAPAVPRSAPSSISSSAPTARLGSADSIRGKAARTAALKAIRSLKSYAFFSTATVGADRTEVAGRATVPASVDYMLSKGSSRSEVLRTAGNTYVRTMPGSWKRLTKSPPAPGPLSSLQGALMAVQGLDLNAAGTQMTGNIPATQARSLGLVTAGALASPVAVTFGLDRTGRVTTFSLNTSAHVGTAVVALAETTHYSEFNHTPPISAP